MQNPKVNLKNRYVALILAWMVPGLGHVYQGRTGKGPPVCRLHPEPVPGRPGDGRLADRLLAMGEPHGEYRVVLLQLPGPVLGRAGCPPGPHPVDTPLVWARHDPLVELHGRAEPERDQRPLSRLGKFVEIGTLYTTVAGLLNILAMYDAFDGPAHLDEEQSTPAETQIPIRRHRSGGLGMIYYWTLLPLVVAISLVYSASRHETWSRIILPFAPPLRRDLRHPADHHDHPPADQHAGLGSSSERSRRARSDAWPRGFAGIPPANLPGRRPSGRARPAGTGPGPGDIGDLRESVRVRLERSILASLQMTERSAKRIAFATKPSDRIETAGSPSR